MKKTYANKKILRRLVFFLWIGGCFALIYHASALFQDQISNSENHIQTGTLSVGFWGSEQLSEDYTLIDRYDLSKPQNHLFSSFRFSSEESCTRYLQIENIGNLPVSYRLHFIVSNNSFGPSLIFSIRPLPNTQGNVENTSDPLSIPSDKLDTILLSNHYLSPYSGKGDLYEITCHSSSATLSPNQDFCMNIALLVTQTDISQQDGIVCAWTLEDILNAPAHSTVFLMNDITTNEDILLDRLINFDFNGYTLTANSFLVQSSSENAAMGLVHGSIVTSSRVPGESYGIVIKAPQSAIHFSDFIGTAQVNGVIYENGNAQSGIEAPPEIDGVYQIEKASHLRWLSQQVNVGESFLGKEFHLVNDIDLMHEAWVPIGQVHPFAGTFDGNGFVIRNLTVEGTNSGAGLFGTVQGTLRNVALEEVRISGSGNLGSLAERCSGIVENCSIKNASVQGCGQLGGLIGDSSAEITKCSVIDSSITCLHSSCSEYNCASGGLVGATAEGEQRISQCTVQTTTIASCKDAGGLIGLRNSGVTVLDCYISSSHITVTTQDSSYTGYAGSLIGRACELYFTDPSESDTLYLQKVRNNTIEASVIVTAQGAFAQANGYNSFTGYLEHKEW